MKGKRLFLKWALFACLIVIGAIIATNLGWDGYLERDPTRITFVTLAVFVLATLQCGRLAWRLGDDPDPLWTKAHLKRVWFFSNLCMYIGMIGTTIGALLMLDLIMHLGVKEPTKVTEVAVTNFAIALVNTVVGGICCVLLQLQASSLEKDLDLLLPDSKEGGQ